MPDLCLQMLLRGRNTVGYTPYPTEVTDAFVAEAAATGIDIFRIFDALNDVEQMRPAIEAVRETGTAVAEVALCYTGDLLDPAERLYTLDYYLRLAEQIVEAGAHVLAIKDMAGLLRPAAAREAGHRAARAVRPAGAPAHPRHRRRPAGHPAGGRRRRGRRGRRRASARWPARPASRRCRRWSPRSRTPSATPGFDLRAVMDLEPYWEAVRQVYAPFESGLPAPTGRVYDHEIPGGQLSNLRQQAIALGLGEKFEQIEAMYAAADRILGPADQGDAVVEGGRRPGAAPRRGRRRPGRLRREPARTTTSPTRSSASWPASWATRPAAGRSRSGPRRWRAGSAPSRQVELSDDDAAALADRAAGRHAQPAAVPGPDQGLRRSRGRPTATSRVLDTLDYLYGLRPGEEHVVELERGVSLIVGLEAIGDADERGHAHGHVHPQRAAAADPGPRPLGQGRRQGGGEGRPGRPGHVARPVRRRGRRSRSARATRSRRARRWRPSRP